MTVIGKIMTFLVFFLSLVFLGFAFSINMLNKDTKTGLSWRAVAENLRAEKDRIQEDFRIKQDSINDLESRVGALTKELATAKAGFDRELGQLRDLRAQDQAKAEAATTAFANSQIAAKAANDELIVRRKDVVDLQAQLKLKDITISDMQRERTVLTNEKTQAQVGLATFMDRARNLEKQVTDLTKQLEQERVLAVERTPPGAVAALPPRPPPDDVKGLVKGVAADGLVSITIGSDAGLLKGHTLEVFRTEPKAEYLGRLQILGVGPHEAVGKMLTPKFAKLVKANDQVASSITGSIRASK